LDDPVPGLIRVRPGSRSLIRLRPGSFRVGSAFREAPEQSAEVTGDTEGEEGNNEEQGEDSVETE